MDLRHGEHDRRRQPLLVLYTIEELAVFIALIRGDALDAEKLAELSARLDAAAHRLGDELSDATKPQP